LNILDLDLVVDKNAELKKQLNNEITLLENAQSQLHSKCEHIVEQSRSKSSLIKNKINNRTTELINIILKDQEKLVNEVTCMQTLTEQKAAQLLFEANNKKSDKLDMESARKDLNNFDTNELNSLKNSLSKFKSDLDLKMKCLSDINYEYEIELNDSFATLDQSNLIGCINQKSVNNRREANDLIVSGSWDNMLKVWNAQTGKVVETLEGHTWVVTCLVVLQYGQLASGSLDKTIRIWGN
jgi:WD40 repeat protein